MDAIRSGFSVRQLFSAGEVGVWYDPSDLTTMFQDSAGTTPVTAVEQPVGLILDKSKGLGLGAELVTNGSEFSTTTGWTQADANSVFTAVSGRLRLTSPNAAVALGYQVLTTVIGKTYNVSVTAYAGTGTCRVLVGITGGNGSLFSETASSVASRQVNIFFTATTATSYLQFTQSTATAGLYTEFDNISVRELPGNHATQATSTKRPVLKIDGNGKYYLKFGGVDDALATASIDFTATDKMTVVAGVRKLSDATTGAICELSSAWATNAGSFALFASPSSAAAYGHRSNGTLNSASDSITFSAPITNVITQTSAISGDSLVGRVNGTQTTTSASDQGTGNYGNYPLYIGSRGGTSLPFNGHLYSLIVRGAQSTDAQIVSAETYVNSKTGAY